MGTHNYESMKQPGKPRACLTRLNYALTLGLLLLAAALGVALYLGYNGLLCDKVDPNIRPDVPTVGTCGYESCNVEKPGMINVHLVPHTHDDVGWLVTVDQYYYKYVQFILDGVIPELDADPTKRFIYVEIAFFSRWYNEQNDATRHVVKRLVDEGRLEFILGGWCMNDEASTHYSAIIDNHKLGFEFLRNNFGDCARPKIGWQIDPFGHSREQASLFAQFGFDGLFFGRLDYQDKDMRMKNKTMEFVWRGSPNNLGEPADLFTGVLPNGYNPPDGYCFDISCFNWNPQQEIIMDDPRMHDYNVDKMVDGFIKAVNDQAKSFATKHLIVTMGSDFNYVQAHMFFKEMDKLIKYVNARQANGSNINLLYSTPSCYLKQLNNDGRTWTTKDDDFFPYADHPHTFWTGYFTSRPSQKYYTRVVNSFFQSVKQMAALAKLDNTFDSGKQLQHLAEVLGVAQHHDGISGTEKQAVAYDYIQRLTSGVDTAQNVVNDAYNVMMKISSGSAPTQMFCSGLNVSECTATETNPSFQVTLYNPLSRPVEYIVRLPVNGMGFRVLQQNGVTEVNSQLLPLTNTVNMPVKAQNELAFPVGVPRLGFATYFVETTKHTDATLEFKEEPRTSPQAGETLEGKYVSVQFDNDGNLQSLTNKTSGISIPLTQDFLYYKAHAGNCSDANFQPSGAYIFRPTSDPAVKVSLQMYRGNIKGVVVQEAFQQFSDWATQTVRVYEDKPYVELEWTIGPIPIDDGVGKEIVSRYNAAGFGNNGVFYTDANGREILERKLNYRPTWKLNQTEPVAGNYYPVNALIAIKQTSGASPLQLTVLTDRTQGGTSLNDGDVELMLHRRLLKDDCKGVGEALNETGSDGNGLVIRGTHYLFLDTVKNSPRMYRTLAQEVFLQPQISFSNVKLAPADYVKQYNTYWSGMGQSLPPNIHLLTLEQFRHNGPVPSSSGTIPYLMRFEHFYEATEDSQLSKPVTFDIGRIFSVLTIADIHELTLGANSAKEKVERLKWKTMGQDAGTTASSTLSRINGTKITLGPMEIITLQANIKM